MLGKKHSLTLLISVARCRCNLSHGNDNIPRTKLIHQCRCKTSLHIHDYIIYLTNYLFNLVFACALVSLFVLLIWIILVTWHRYFAYTTNIHIYIHFIHVCTYMLGCYCMPPRCVCATWQSHYILSAPCAVSRSRFHMKELSLARYISTRRRRRRTFIHTHTHTHTVNTHSTVLASIRDL